MRESARKSEAFPRGMKFEWKWFFFMLLLVFFFFKSHRLQVSEFTMVEIMSTKLSSPDR